ncbi:TraV family lipoprotein [Sphingomonas morindae]|uniref:TraV family lipoprotein n=1 Tax=Sphingomonas morindae TaxID=1541170 RepID=A0ABY4XEA7_9SPHN|nr:TraV family lipoprotein [Sphingomonas morindae]USI75222.1 TraV family lipoprotein [Sphingomonas morindae]
MDSPSQRRPLLFGSSALVVLALLSGCTTFGGNVKGSFSCAAPDGICAPSSSIDDRALAMIAGEAGASEMPVAVPARRSSSRTTRTASTGQVVPAAPLDARRTQERVLRIVFQPYIDERGRLHEASAVHAVVQLGEWQQQALADTTSIPERNSQASVARPESLADAVERADLATIQTGGVDPNLPDPAAVAAARARRADPVKAIQDDVAARLAPKAGRTPAQSAMGVTKRRAETKSVESAVPPAQAGEPKPPASASVERPAPETKATPRLPTPTTAAAEALTRVKASPEFPAKAAQAESDARAAGQTGPVPQSNSKVQSTVRAPGFPAIVPEEN